MVSNTSITLGVWFVARLSHQLASHRSTISGGTWFSTQLFYSNAFYEQSALSGTSKELEIFVVSWFRTWYEITADASEENQSKCFMAGVVSKGLQEQCEFVKEFD